MRKLEILKDKLLFDGKLFYLASGDMHYFRIMPGGWRCRLELMKDFGLTAVQTYVPWNLHEPKKGIYNFDGMLNLSSFLKLADEVGLKVMLRPSPYMCAEWDMGGLPSWLLKDRNTCIRSSDPEFFTHVESYTERLCKEFVPYLSTNGGPIIAVAIENEYGSYGNDKKYLRSLIDILVKKGVNVPFYTASGYDIFKLYYGDCEDTWAGVDFRIESEYAIAKLREYQPDKPPLICEYWSGRPMHWGANFAHRDPKPIAEAYQKALELGAYVNFYMFCGGTNFGFMNGANYGRPYSDKKGNTERYMHGLTSYDVDALVSENGVPTHKYYICRRVLDIFLGKPEREDNVPPYHTQEIKDVALTETAPLFDNLSLIAERITQSINVKAMEDLDQDYGFIMYSTIIDYTDDRVRYLRIDGLHDRAAVYANGKYIGTYMRDRNCELIKFTIPKTGVKLDILVENMGRINYSYYLAERKGITGFVRVDIEEPDNKGFLHNKAILMNWTIYTLPMKDLSKLKYVSTILESLPGFYKGVFNATAGIDTFLHMKGWTKGCVWINGFNLGRYWNIGPQETLYVPGELLKEGKNEIVIFEIHQPLPGLKVNFIKEHILDGDVTELL